MLGGVSEVITLNVKQQIIKMHLEGKSQRKIAKELKKSRNTVKKYIKEFENSKLTDVRNLPIPEEIIKPPTYTKRVGRKRVLSDEIIEKIRGYIKENEWKRENNLGKQQMKIIDMHEKLIEEGCEISYTTVRNFVNTELAKKNEVFIRRNCEPGYEVEFDWGEIKIEVNGKLRSYSLAVFTLAHSNYRFAKIYESETMVCVLDIHSLFNEHIDFIPTVFTYDNMRTVVKSFIGSEREITDGMKNISDYYGFKIRLCEPRKGNEKGHVERSVEYIRRKAFSSNYKFTSLKEAEEHLTRVLIRINQQLHHQHLLKHIELMEHERSVSKPAITPFDVAELIECRVDKYSTVVIKQNHYSVPEGHVGKFIKAKVGAEKIKLFIDGELVAEHKRNWGLHQWEMNIYHYLKTFEKKKGAIAQSECLKQAPDEIKMIYTNYYTGNEKDFIELLLYIQEKDNLGQVLEAIEKLNNIRFGFVTTERIQFICEQTNTDKLTDENKDDIMKQSERNLKAYADMFDQSEEGDILYG